MTFPRLTIAALALVALFGCSHGRTSAAADGGSPTTTTGSTAPPTTAAGRAVTFAVAAPPPVSLDPHCDSASVCLVPVKGPEYKVTGDAQGTGVNAGAAYLLPGGAGAFSTALSTFSGSVQGCGQGTILERFDGAPALVDFWVTAHFGADEQGGGTGTWSYIDGTGTGDFTHLRGGGEFHLATVASDMSATDAFTGRISC